MTRITDERLKEIQTICTHRAHEGITFFGDIFSALDELIELRAKFETLTRSQKLAADGYTRRSRSLPSDADEAAAPVAVLEEAMRLVRQVELSHEWGIKQKEMRENLRAYLATHLTAEPEAPAVGRDLSIGEDVYDQLSDMIAPHVTDLPGGLPGSVTESFRVLLANWLASKAVEAPPKMTDEELVWLTDDSKIGFLGSLIVIQDARDAQWRKAIGGGV